MKPNRITRNTVVAPAGIAPEQVKKPTTAVANRLTKATTEVVKAESDATPAALGAVSTAIGNSEPLRLSGTPAELDLALRDAALNYHTSLGRFTALAAQALDQEIWTYFGFSDQREYFEERLGISWRTVCRCLSIHRAVEALPGAERDEVRGALLHIGIKKSAILVPALRAATGGTGNWRDWIQDARAFSSTALQARVSEALGTGRARVESLAEQNKGLGWLLNHLPPQLAPWAESIFRGIARRLESQNLSYIIIALLWCAETELASVGIEVDPPLTDRLSSNIKTAFGR